MKKCGLLKSKLLLVNESKRLNMCNRKEKLGWGGSYCSDEDEFDSLDTGSYNRWNGYQGRASLPSTKRKKPVFTTSIPTSAISSQPYSTFTSASTVKDQDRKRGMKTTKRIKTESSM